MRWSSEPLVAAENVPRAMLEAPSHACSRVCHSCRKGVNNLRPFSPLFKVVDLLHRVEGDGEPMSAASVFCTSDEEGLCDLGCWIDFSAVASTVLEQDPNNDTADATVEARTAAECEIDKALADGDIINEGQSRGEENAAEAEERRVSFPQDTVRRQEAEAVAEWLRSIESQLVEKCAEVCDTAWYDLGETITYQGRPVAHSLPAVAMDTAMQRREDREDREKLGRRAR